MIILYILLIVIGAIPLWITVRYIRLEERIRLHGISTTGTITNIKTTRYSRGPVSDRVHVRYDGLSGQGHTASFVSKHGKYRSGRTVPVKYLPEKPDKIIVEAKRGYWSMLVFTILLMLFIIFAVYKIDEMLKG
ncbi:DUF3592 domain-containing protein [Chitinophaga sp.]|uniref:DUF3592 domain-containing protein n=1 Tax=Chitinophaga sp. TaxID=1869181 RepID=UPI002620752B|nr:DUF3592 domain-containing protein [uncultured Chitinophaga sp.]